MTNAEKYLKDGVDLEQLDKELIDYICNQGTDNPYYTYVSDFFKEQVKPTLTEDERVILRNIKEEKIGRLENGNLYVTTPICENSGRNIYLRYFTHLFQFIKERRRIFNKRIIGGEMNKKELEWIHKTKEELIEELDKAYKEIIELNRIIDKWERIYKPKTEIVNVGGNVFEKDLQKITYINKYEGYHRAERRRI